MQELGALEIAQVLQRGNQRMQVMSIDRPNVVETEFLEQGGWQHHALGLLFEPAGKFQKRRNPAQDALAHVPRLRIELPAHQVRQITVERAHRRADAHVVVVENDQQAQVLFHSSVVERLERHPRGHGAIANHCNAMVVFSLLAGRHGHAQRR